MMMIGDRIRQARKHAGFTQKQLAEKVEVSVQAISQLEKGESKQPKSTNLIKIASATGTSFEWIATGKGQMLISGSVEMAVNDTLGHYNVTAEDLDLKQLVPVISWVRAGQFCEAHDPLEPGDAEDWLPRPKGASKSTYALTVKGDSMTSPYPGTRSYPQGIIIFVDPEKEVLPGSRGVFKLPESNEVTFKELVSDAGQLYLKPLNPQYDKIPVTEKMTTCGKVIGSFFAE